MGVGSVGRNWVTQGLETPPRATFLKDFFPGTFRFGASGRTFFSGVVGPLKDPLGEHGDLVVRQLGLGRHLEFFVHMLHRNDETTDFGLARNYNGAALPSLPESRRRIERQPSFYLLAVGVACKAVRRKDRQNVLRKIGVPGQRRWYRITGVDAGEG